MQIWLTSGEQAGAGVPSAGDHARVRGETFSERA